MNIKEIRLTEDNMNIIPKDLTVLFLTLLFFPSSSFFLIKIKTKKSERKKKKNNCNYYDISHLFMDPTKEIP